MCSLSLAGCGGSSSGSTYVQTPSPSVTNAGGPYSGTVGQPVTFNGSASTGPAGQALSYAWNFGDSIWASSPGPARPRSIGAAPAGFSFM
ncbi:MAG: PKD domain-containing protein [Terracidiphilus sp.]